MVDNIALDKFLGTDSHQSESGDPGFLEAGTGMPEVSSGMDSFLGVTPKDLEDQRQRSNYTDVNGYPDSPLAPTAEQAEESKHPTDPVEYSMRHAAALVDGGPVQSEPNEAMMNKVKVAKDRGIIRSTQASYTTAKLQDELSQLDYYYVFVLDDPNNPVYAARSARLEDQIMDEGQYIQDNGSLFREALNAMASIIPMNVEATIQGMPAAGGAAMGAGAAIVIAGQIGPQVVTPEEFVLAPIGAGAVGLATLQGYRSAYIYKSETGRAYRRLTSITDVNGDTIDPSIVRAAAQSVGVLNTLIESVQVTKLLSTIPMFKGLAKETLQAVAQKTLLKVLSGQPLKSIIASTATRVAGTMVYEGTTEAAQQAIELTAEQWAIDMMNTFKGSDFSDVEYERVKSELMASFRQAALGSGFLAFPGSAAQGVMTSNIGHKSRLEAKSFNELKKLLPDDIHPDKAKEVHNSWMRAKEVFLQQRDVRLHNNQLDGVHWQEDIEAITGADQKSEDVAFAMLLRRSAMENPVEVKQLLAAHLDPENAFTFNDEFMRIHDLSQNLTVQQVKFADGLQAIYNDLGMEAVMDVAIMENLRDLYSSHEWDFKDDVARSSGFGKFFKRTKHQQQRKFDTIYKGIAEGHELKITNIAENLVVYRDSMIRAIEQKRLFDSMMETDMYSKPVMAAETVAMGPMTADPTPDGLPMPSIQEAEALTPEQVKAAQKALRPTMKKKPMLTVTKREGYDKITIPNFTYWAPVAKVKAAKDTEVLGREVFVTPEGTVMGKAEVWAPPHVAKAINRIFGTSKLKGVPGMAAVDLINRTVKSVALAVSGFHAIAYTNSFFFPSPRLDSMRVLDAYRHGGQMIHNYDDFVELGVRNGLTVIGYSTDIQQHIFKRNQLASKIAGKYTKSAKVLGHVQDLLGWSTNIIFNKVGPNLKVKSFVAEYLYLQNKYPNKHPDDAAGAAAKLINADFGGLHLERMERDPTLQHMARLGLLAPDWTESNIKTMVGSVTKAFNSKDTSVAMHEVYRMFWMRVAVRGLAVNSAINYLNAGGDVEKILREYERLWDEREYYKLMQADISSLYHWMGGDPRDKMYFSAMGHFLDAGKFFMHTGQAAIHKRSPLVGLIIEGAQMEDWRGRRFTTMAELFENGWVPTLKKDDYGWNKNKNAWSQTSKAYTEDMWWAALPSYLLHQIASNSTMPVSNLYSHMSGDLDEFQAIAATIGLRVSKDRGPRPFNPRGKFKTPE